MPADWKPSKRISDRNLTRRLHRAWRECALCGSTGWKVEPPAGRAWAVARRVWFGLSLHHIHSHPRDDVEANLVMLCGSGTTGCHGEITENHREALAALGVYLMTERDDVLPYLTSKIGSEGRARAWMERTYRYPVG